MAITITLATGETFTLDETSGLQNGADGTPTGSPTSDSDVDITTLPTAFSDYLFGTDPGELSLDDTFPTDVGVASSSTTFIHVVSDGGPISTLGLTDADGDAFTGTTVNDATSSGLSTVGGDDIFLISALDNQVVLGMYDSDGDDTLDAVAFAVYMQTDGTLGADEYVQLWSVTFTALENPEAGNTDDDYDDVVDLLSLVSITATGSKTFNFDALPSGQNLFGIVGDVNDAIVVTGELPVLKTDGTYTNTSDTINTSKGGGPTTIGVDNQSFDPIGGGTAVNDGAFFTYVEDPDPRYLAGVAGGLNQNEADDADNVLFGNTKEVDGAFFKIVQVVGNGDANLTITAYDLTNDTQDGRTFVQNQGALGGSAIPIDQVWVYDGSIDPANLVEDSALEGTLDDNPDVEISFSGGIATVTGLQDGYIVVWHTTADHDQVRVQAATGSSAFDIGLFGITEGAETSQPLAGTTFVEDSRPSFSADIDGGTIAYDAAATPITNTLNGLEGTDSPGTYAITSYEPAFNLLGAHITPLASSDGQSVIYFDDKNQDGDQDAGETLYYTMSLTPAGSYTFTVNNAPAAPPLEFNFAGLPSGQNLFGMVAGAGAPNGPGILFFSDTADIKDPGNGEMDKGSGTINTSQGGGPTTIGTNNQMIDPGEGIFFTIINDPLDNYLANVTNGLDQNEADDADNMQFASLREVPGAFLRISQTQGNAVEACTIEAFDITSSGGRGLIAASGQTADHVDMLTVSVWSDFVGGNLLETVGDSDADGISVSIDSDGVAHVSGLEAGYVVSWTTDGNHDQVLVTGAAGKFDIGGFGLVEPQQILDHDLDFEVTLTDADGDFVASNTFTISIDA
jgi:hypothetical protein